jgi:hypothetical protein
MIELLEKINNLHEEQINNLHEEQIKTRGSINIIKGIAIFFLIMCYLRLKIPIFSLTGCYAGLPKGLTLPICVSIQLP